MAKIQKTIQKPKLQNKPNYIRRIVRAVGMIIFAGIILVCLFPFLLLLLPLPAPKNPAQNAAAIMPSFAEKYNLKKVSEYNGAQGVDNGIPFFSYSYQGKQSIDDLHSLIKSYLEENGYKISEVQEQDLEGKQNDNGKINDGYPYWRMQGLSGVDKTLETVITDHDSNSKDSVLSITFKVRTCDKCTDALFPKELKDWSTIITPFAQQNGMSQIAEYSHYEDYSVYNPQYERFYTTDISSSILLSQLKTYLQKSGYNDFREELFDPQCKKFTDCKPTIVRTGDALNDYTPYWVFSAYNNRHHIQGEITDKTYSGDIYSLYGENPVPEGKNVLKIIFTDL